MQAQNIPVSRQGGAVLILGLIMLLLMTIVGLAAVRGTGLQETMASNMRQRHIAFHAAEAGLREAEDELKNLVNKTFDGTEKGLLADQGQLGQPLVARWDADDWLENSILTDLELVNIKEANRPRYVVEEVRVPDIEVRKMLGCSQDPEEFCFDVDYFRVSSRGVSGSGEAEAVLQSTYGQLK
ncbi:pilus assembly PilX family protein [Marinimicrobium agarilyticum]|uniref:pilus assembly PilX family protein n=1 Tax=Marinimicrobium agarilyticum TaxID=306546 RepID=UPI00146C4DC8|nr:PilX N-terminal domain-containing pilus assembly protein [Marinimicrobium agarilyticum]